MFGDVQRFLDVMILEDIHLKQPTYFVDVSGTWSLVFCSHSKVRRWMDFQFNWRNTGVQECRSYNFI